MLKPLSPYEIDITYTWGILSFYALLVNTDPPFAKSVESTACVDLLKLMVYQPSILQFE